MFFLLDAPVDVRQRAAQIADQWNGLITWHADTKTEASLSGNAAPTQSSAMTACMSPGGSLMAGEASTSMLVTAPQKPARRSNTTQVGYVNRNNQEVVRPTGKTGTDHGQYAYVLRCRICGHEYGANGSDIWLRRCPEHDRGARGLLF